MTRNEVLNSIAAHRLFAVIRAESADQAVAAGRALHAGGIRLLEMTCTTPDVASAIARLMDANLPDAVVGAGSVLTDKVACNVLAAGAQFVVSPVRVKVVIDACVQKGAVCIPGAATANEIVQAIALGAEIVKIFPAGLLGGPSFIRALREPMPYLKLCPTGGVNEANVVEYFRAGAVAVGVGGSLVDRKAMAAGDFAALTRAARTFVELAHP